MNEGAEPGIRKERTFWNWLAMNRPPKTVTLKGLEQGLLWWSNGKDIVIPMQWGQVQTLVRQLRSHMPHDQKNPKTCGSE